MNVYTKTIVAFAAVILAALGLPLQAQQHVCGTDQLMEKRLQQYPELREHQEQAELQYQSYVENISTNRRAGGVQTIPVVVHIIQTSAVETVSDADVYSQIDVLNEDFRKIAGTAGDGGGVDTQYEFCLASIDPSGCPTDGINRLINPGLAFHNQDDEALLKGLIQWDPSMYLNIWVPRTIETSNSAGSVIGYATFPTWITFQPQLDGIVVHSGFFGRNSNPTYIGRTTTHEVGHWLGLFHTFQSACTGNTAGSCANAGDRVCDTPQAMEPNFGCPNINSCTDSPVDDPDQIENYMDYANGNCQNMFTQGQVDRMDFFTGAYRSNTPSASNQSETGCDGTVSPGCVPTAEFSSDLVNACVGQQVTFSDLSSGPAESWFWEFQGGTPATDTTPTPTVTYSQPGIYNVKLTVTNGLGTDDEFKISYVNVTEASLPPLAEDFESIFFLPQGWYVENLGGTQNWERTNAAAASGNWSMVVENWQANNAGNFFTMNTNVFDLSGLGIAQLSWDYSYKRYNAFQLDTFSVRVSSDCGSTWNTIWEEGGIFLPTVPGNSIASAWVPSDSSHWRTVTVDIDSFAGEPDIRFQFKVKSGNGSNLYLDNINMSALVASPESAVPNWAITVRPNPFRDEPIVDYKLAKSGTVKFSLMDINGRVLYRHDTGRLAPGKYTLPANAELYNSLSDGVYFLKAESEFGQVTKKLIKMAQ